MIIDGNIWRIRSKYDRFWQRPSCEFTGCLQGQTMVLQNHAERKQYFLARFPSGVRGNGNAILPGVDQTPSIILHLKLPIIVTAHNRAIRGSPQRHAPLERRAPPRKNPAERSRAAGSSGVVTQQKLHRGWVSSHVRRRLSCERQGAGGRPRGAIQGGAGGRGPRARSSPSSPSSPTPTARKASRDEAQRARQRLQSRAAATAIPAKARNPWKIWSPKKIFRRLFEVIRGYLPSSGASFSGKWSEGEAGLYQNGQNARHAQDAQRSGIAEGAPGGF